MNAGRTIFAQLFDLLPRRAFDLAVERYRTHGRPLHVRAAFAVDSTTIDLCLKLFPWARFRRRKGGIKAHVVLDLRVGIPVFMRVSDAKASDVSVLDHLTFQPGASYVLDRGYID